jgi:hypothetical protein
VTGEDYDDRIIRQAQMQQEHERKLAQVEADRAHKLAQEDTRRARSRHTMMTWVVVVVGILLALGMLAGTITWNVTDDRRQRTTVEREKTRVEVERVRVAETCIREGNIWHADNCLITRRESP